MQFTLTFASPITDTKVGEVKAALDKINIKPIREMRKDKDNVIVYDAEGEGVQEIGELFWGWIENGGPIEGYALVASAPANQA
jgi:hypothetical protein